MSSRSFSVATPVGRGNPGTSSYVVSEVMGGSMLDDGKTNDPFKCCGDCGEPTCRGECESRFYWVEFPNSDVGPFVSRDDAETYRRYEGNLDETQVFTSGSNGLKPLVLREFCPEACCDKCGNSGLLGLHASWCPVPDES